MAHDSSHEAPAQAPGTFHLSRRRVYILPTRHGTAFALALLVMLVGSMNYGNSLGYLLTFLLGSVALVSALHAYRNLAGLTLRVGLPEAVFAGQPLRVQISLEDHSGRSRTALALSGAARPPASPGRPRRARPHWTAVSLDLEPDSITTHRLALPTEHRGLHEITGLQISSRYPLGLFRAWSPLEHAPAPLRAHVYPRPGGRRPLPPPQRESPHHERRAAAGRDDFAGLRDYHRGDPPKHIHWKAVARGQGVPVKTFSGGGSAVLELAWSQTGPSDDPEERLSELARWAVEAEADGLDYALELPGTSITPGAGAAHLHRTLAALAEYPGSAPGRAG